MRRISKISNLEYKRRYFNEVLSESFADIHMRVCEIKPGEKSITGATYDTLHEASKAFFKKELNLDKATINETKNSILKNAPYFTRVILEEAEEMAEEKAEEVSLNKELPIPEDPEMSDEDKEVMDAVFTSKMDEDDITTVNKATASALFAENRKAEEMKKALDVIENDNIDKQTLEESVNRITNRGVTSLMDAILTGITENVIKESINENSTNVGDIIKQQSTYIKNEACYAYSLYETMNAFGFKTYDSKDIQKIAEEIYYNK